MCGERSYAVSVEHLIDVAVVGSDQALAAHLEDGINDLAYAVVGSLDGLDSSLEYAGVAYHIAVCEVEDNNVVLAGQDALYAFLGNGRLAHLRLEIVGCNLRGRDQRTILARVLLLNTAVEEERNVGVLLGLGNAELGHAQIGDIFAERVLQALRLEGNFYARNGSVILRHADVVDLRLYALKAGELRINERTGDLTRTVGTEVCEDDRVVVFDGCALGYDNRNNELVGYAVCVGLLHRLVSGSSVLALAECDSVVCLLYTIPAVIAVHRVVTAGYGCNAADLDSVDLRLQAVDILDTGLRRRVTAVHEAVEANLAQTVAACQLEQREHMVNVGMHTAVRQQAENVQGGIEPLALVDCAHQGRVLEEISVLDGLGDAGQLLIYDAACADVGVANLGVAHLAVRQTNVQTGCADIGERVLGEDLIEIRLFSRLDGVALGLLAVAEAVHDDERGRLLRAFCLLGSSGCCLGLAAALSCRLFLLSLCCSRLCRSGLAGTLCSRLLCRSRICQNIYRCGSLDLDYLNLRHARHSGFFHTIKTPLQKRTIREQKGTRYAPCPPPLNGEGVFPFTASLSYWLAASTIVAKSALFRDAPPIRPPSTSG